MTSSRQLPLLDEPKDLLVHHVLVDSAKRSPEDTNYAYTAYLGHEGIIKNVVAISLLSCVIPHGDSNVRSDANLIHLREYYPIEGIWRYVTATVPPGYYATRENFRVAVLAALTQAVRAPPLLVAIDKPEYNLVYYENSTACIHLVDRHSSTNQNPAFIAFSKSGVPVAFLPVFGDDRRTVLYKLGFDTRHAYHSVEDDASFLRANFTSERLVDISTTDYVDIDIVELPTAGLKMTTETRRVFARVPTVSNLARTVHDLTERNVLRRHFYPINLEKVTIRLFDQYGLPFENNNADHTLDLEVITMGAPPLTVAPSLSPPTMEPVVAQIEERCDTEGEGAPTKATWITPLTASASAVIVLVSSYGVYRFFKPKVVSLARGSARALIATPPRAAMAS